MKTEQQIVDGANALARRFYTMMGNQVREDFKFYEATHPQEVLCWNMAVDAYQHIEGTEVDNALAEIQES